MSGDDYVGWSDVIGQKDVKNTLMSTIITPLRTRGCNLPFTSVLICGPPGTGKTLLRQAIEHELGDVVSFHSKHSSDFISKGFSKQLLKSFLQQSSEIRPAVIWIDDLFSTDGMFPCAFCRGLEGENLQRYITCWMNTNDVNKEGVVIVGSTQNPWVADESLIQSFHHHVYMGKMEEESRYRMIQRSLKDEIHVLKEGDLWKIAQHTNSFTGADMQILIRSACSQPLRRITKSHHFKKVSKARDNPGELKDIFYKPCDANDEGAIAMPWTDVPADRLILPVITMDDFLQAMTSTRSSVRDEEWQEIYNFKSVFSQS
ncbi:vacuolar protein sorting-associated protein 4B-like [Saccoglossus kowalevskii]|uniref:Vacuolar protein sorting-associated protein 4B-like n=1 Tax=Saccoglossus kowalevskii TaxID=10224 RepID=A0ABM0GSC7_SACKO|nr:PREDICTED: vacuolar protein sorting-associated protein 4B-like [Saccoglossus kowalevskii]